jgi:hypothetical protein
MVAIVLRLTGAASDISAVCAEGRAIAALRYLLSSVYCHRSGYHRPGYHRFRGEKTVKDWMQLCGTTTVVSGVQMVLAAGAIMMSSSVVEAQSADAGFGPGNPFYAPSALPFQAPPFDRIKDGDYQPAIEAGMAEQRKEIRAIADNAAAPTFENTIVAMEKTGALFQRAYAAFNGVTGANTNPVLEKVQRE